MSAFDNWEQRENNTELISNWTKENPDPSRWFTLYLWEENRNPEQEKILKDKLNQYHVPYTEEVKTFLNSPAAIEGIVGGEIDIANIDKILSKYQVVNNVPYYYGVPVPVYNAIIDEQISIKAYNAHNYGDEDQNDVMNAIDK